MIARWGSYHGNSLGALDLSGRRPLRRPYEAWLGRFRHVSAAYPYRGGRCRARRRWTTQALAAELEVAIRRPGAGRVAAFVAEPIVGATLAAVEPPDGLLAGHRRRLPPPRRAAHRRRGHDRLRADRHAGSAMDHWGVRPDLLVAAKGATSGYWPFGFVAASGEVCETVTARGGFVHGFTYSHQPVAAAVAREVLRILEDEGWSRRARRRASGCRRSSASGSAATRTSATSAAAACSSGWSSSGTARRAGRTRAPRASPRRSSGRARARAARSTRDGQRQRHRRRHDPARPAVRRHRRRARPDRGRADGLDRPRRGLDRGGRAGPRHPVRNSKGAVSSAAWTMSRRSQAAGRSHGAPARVAPARSGPPGRRSPGGVAAAMPSGSWRSWRCRRPRRDRTPGRSASPSPRVVLVDPGGALAIVDGAGGGRTVHAPSGTAFTFPAWSPDGNPRRGRRQHGGRRRDQVFGTGPDATAEGRPCTRAATRRRSTCTGRPTAARSRSSPSRARASPCGPRRWTAAPRRRSCARARRCIGPGRIGPDAGPHRRGRGCVPGRGAARRDDDQPDRGVDGRLPGTGRVERRPVRGLRGHEAGRGAAVVAATSDGASRHEVDVFGSAAFGFAPSGPRLAFVAGRRPTPSPRSRSGPSGSSMRRPGPFGRCRRPRSSRSSGHRTDEGL